MEGPGRVSTLRCCAYKRAQLAAAIQDLKHAVGKAGRKPTAAQVVHLMELRDRKRSADQELARHLADDSLHPEEAPSGSTT